MAGIWDIVRSDPNDPEQTRLNVTQLRTELYLVGRGIRTRADAKNHLEVVLGRALTNDESSDLAAMANNFEQGSIQVKLTLLHDTEGALNSAELNRIQEAEFRSIVGIP